MPEKLDLPIDTNETNFEQDLGTTEQDEIIFECEEEGQDMEAVDPVKIAKAVWRWVRKKIDEYNS